MAEFKNFCRVCLSTERKFYHLKEQNLISAFEQMSGLSYMKSDKRIPEYLCFECWRRLLNYESFRNNSRRANSFLLELLENGDQFTENKLKSMNTLTLVKKTYAPNHCDMLIDCSDELEEDTLIPLKMVKVEMHDIKEEPNTDDNCNFKSGMSDDKPLSSITLKKTNRLNTKEKNIKKKVTSTHKSKVNKRKKVVGGDLDDKLISLVILNGDEQLIEFNKRSDSANYKNAVYKCVHCLKGFLDEDAFKDHMVRHTDKCGAYECDICKIHFKNVYHLKNHMTSHSHRYSCRHCTYVTFKKQTAKLHENWHNGKTYQCPHCKELFFKFSTYMGHIRIKHPSDNVCQLCGFSFVSEKGLSLHKKLKHRLDADNIIPADSPYCESCDLRFATADALERHKKVSSRHTVKIDDESQKDSIQYRPRKRREGNTVLNKSLSSGVSRNRRPLKPENPIPCEQCDMQLEDYRAYYVHFRRAHPDKNRTNYPLMKSSCMCEVCGRMFQTLALLQDHSNTHTDEKRFKCTLCDKSFQQRQRLVAHAHVHSGRRAVYACDVCGKTFTTQSNRQRHMFSHTGLRPFKCEMCGKCFKHASEKRSHVTYVHLKKPWPKKARGRDGGCRNITMSETRP